MKVYLGKYKSWIGPYQLADLLKYVGVSEDTCHDIGEKLNALPVLSKACNWIHSKNPRKLKVHIDDYDVWSLDHTLALIITPSLRRLRDTNHGSGHVDDEDVPESLRANGFVGGENGEIDDRWHDRWKYVLDEMIFAFESLSENPDFEDKMHNGTLGYHIIPVDKDGNQIPRENAKLFIQKNHDSLPWPKFDSESYQDYNARMQNGFRLFGKYFRQLWD